MGVVDAAGGHLVTLAVTREPLEPYLADPRIGVGNPSTVRRWPDKRDIRAQCIQLRRTHTNVERNGEKCVPHRANDSVVGSPGESLKKVCSAENKFRCAGQVGRTDENRVAETEKHAVAARTPNGLPDYGSANPRYVLSGPQVVNAQLLTLDGLDYRGEAATVRAELKS